MSSRWWPRLWLPAILTVAAGLRFWGLGWGLPNSLHSYSYHPDEFLTIGAAGIVLSSLLPRFYNYPSLYIYLAAFAVAFGSAYGLAHGPDDSYLCARVVTAVIGVAAVAVAYWAGKSLYGDRPGHVVPDVPDAQAIGLVATLILCIAPLHVQHSHFATVDVPSTLFVAACLGFAGLVLTRGSWRDYLLCGVMAGLAAGTKYNAGLVVLSLVAAHFLGGRERNAGIRRLFAALGCALAAFLVSTPGAILQWPNFVYGLTYEIRHAAAGHGLVFAGTGNGFVYTFTSSLWYGLGPALAILFIVAAVHGLASRSGRRVLVILAFAVPYYALISISQVRFARYALPLFPAAALLIAWMACDLWSSPRKCVKWAWAGLFGAVLVGTLLYTIALDRLFVLPTPQDRAARWIFANIPKGSRIGVIEVPWFYSPPYSKQAGFGTLALRTEAMAKSPYSMYVSPSYEFLRKTPDLQSPNWVVFSDYEVSDAKRIGGINVNEYLAGFPEGWARDQVRNWLIRSIIEIRYANRATFSDPLRALGVPFGSTQSLPHDMRYPAPTIWIYERKQ